MADLTITAANVRAESDARIQTGTAAETITPGDALYNNSSSQLALADATDAAKDALVGVSVGYADAGEKLAYVTSGGMDVGATLTVGEAYGCSPNAAGGIAPTSDLGSTNYVSFLGIATTTTRLVLGILNTGEALP